MTRKYSSTSVQTTLSNAISSSATSMTVTAGTGSALMGGQSLAAGNVDQFALVLEPDTTSEEIVFATQISTDTFVIIRGRAGTSAVAHPTGAVVKHVLTGEDLSYFETNVSAAISASSTSTLTNKTIALGSNTVSGTTAQFNTALTDGDFATLAGTEVLSNKVLLTPEERCTVAASSATGTVNFDVATQAILYYTSNAAANFTLNFRGTSGITLSSLLTVGDSITLTFLNTNGATAYYPNVIQVDGSTVTPKWQGGTAPSVGNASSIDAYTFTIIKTAATPTYTVFGTQTRFA